MCDKADAVSEKEGQQRQALAETSQDNVSAPPVINPNPVSLLEQALARGVSSEQLQQFMDLQERYEANEARKAFAAAFVRCQKKMPAIQNQALNDHTQSMYSKLEHINAGITPIYTAEGFSVSFSEGAASIPEMIRADLVIRHKFGHTESHYIEMPIDQTGIKDGVNKTAIQGKKSTFTIACRTLLVMLFNLTVGDDVDGNAVGGADRITDEQALELEVRIKENRISMDALKRKFKVKDLSQIKAADLEKWNEMIQQILASRT